MRYATNTFAARLRNTIYLVACGLPLVLKAYLVGFPATAPTNWPNQGTLTFTNQHDTNFLIKIGPGSPNGGATGSGFIGYGLSAGGIAFSGSPFHHDTGDVITVSSTFHSKFTYTNTESVKNDRAMCFTYQYFDLKY